MLDMQFTDYMHLKADLCNSQHCQPQHHVLICFQVNDMQRCLRMSEQYRLVIKTNLKHSSNFLHIQTQDDVKYKILQSTADLYSDKPWTSRNVMSRQLTKWFFLTNCVYQLRP